MTTNTITRTLTLADIPFIGRDSHNGIVLNSELAMTQDIHPRSAYLSSLLLGRGVYTLLARKNEQQVIGQLRYRAEDLNAQVFFITPSQDEVGSNELFLHLLDGMAREMGKHGAHALLAEVDTQSALFETMRQARFATYVRQTVWRHDPVQAQHILPLTEEESSDQIGIMSLICHTIPTLQQPYVTPNPDMQGLVYRHNGHVEAYIAYSEGKHGVYVLPYIHPDMLGQARNILESALARIARTSKLPSYICIRSYQVWLEDAVRELNYDLMTEQAIMVRHIAVGVRQAPFARSKIQGKLEIANNAPPYWSTARPLDED